MSARTALTTTGIGMAMLLAGCGSGGSNSAGGAPTSAGTATSSQAESPSSPAASSSTTAKSSTSDASSAPPSASSTHATRKHGATKTSSKAAKPPAAKPSASSPGDKPVPRCTVKQLRLAVGGGNADMQGAHRSLRFTNVSNSTCKLTGAPGVSYVTGSDGHQVGPPAKRIVGHQPIVLIPNATASAGLFISSAPHKSACAQTTVRGIRVYPPDSYQAAFVPMTEVTCSSAKSGPYLKVGPVLPGSNNTV